MTGKTEIPLPEGTSRRLISMILGFGVAVGLAAAPFLGARRIPGFEPLIAIFPEQYQTLLIPFSSLLIGLVALAIEFYAGERIARQSIRKNFGVILLIVIAGILTLLVLYLLFVKRVPNPVVGADEVEIVSWSRLPSPPCDCPPHSSDVDCIQGIAFNTETCWSERSITLVKLALFLSYLIAIEGFAVLAGLLVLRPPRRQKPNLQPESLQPQKTEQPQEAPKRSRASEPEKPGAKPKKPIAGTPAPRPKKPKPPK